jgi:hypothetical protein
VPELAPPAAAHPMADGVCPEEVESAANCYKAIARRLAVRDGMLGYPETAPLRILYKRLHYRCVQNVSCFFSPVS